MKKSTLISLGAIIILAFIITYLLSFKKAPDTRQISAKTLLLTAGDVRSDYGSKVAVDKNGNIYAIGSFKGMTKFGNFQKKSSGFGGDNFLIKYNNQGDIEWVEVISSASNDLITCNTLALDDSNNIYVAGSYNGTIIFGDSLTKTAEKPSNGFIAKYSTKGKVLWAESILSESLIEFYDLAVDKHGNVYLTGAFMGTLRVGDKTTTSAGDVDAFLAKYTPDGKAEWAKSAGGTGFDIAKGIAIDTHDNLYMTGFFSKDASFDQIKKSSNGRDHLFVAKYTSLGQVQWVESTESENTERGEKLVVDAADNIYLTGTYWKEVTFGETHLSYGKNLNTFIAKYSPDGKVLWVKSGWCDNNFSIEDMTIDKNGNPYLIARFSGKYVAGSTIKTSAGSVDIFICKYDDKGNIVWLKTAGSTSAESGNGIAVDDSLRVYAIGGFEEKVSFDDLTGVSAGDSDIYIWRFVQ